jgi:hypothetical protein
MSDLSNGFKVLGQIVLSIDSIGKIHAEIVKNGMRVELSPPRSGGLKEWNFPAEIMLELYSQRDKNLLRREAAENKQQKQSSDKHQKLFQQTAKSFGLEFAKKYFNDIRSAREKNLTEEYHKRQILHREINLAADELTDDDLGL